MLIDDDDDDCDLSAVFCHMAGFHLHWLHLDLSWASIFNSSQLILPDAYCSNRHSGDLLLSIITFFYWK